MTAKAPPNNSCCGVFVVFTAYIFNTKHTYSLRKPHGFRLKYEIIPSTYRGGGGARKAFIDCSILRLLDSSIVRFIDSFVRRRENTRRKTGRTRTGRNTRVPPSQVSQDAARRFRMPESMSVAHIVVGIIPKFRISRQKRRARSECELTCQKNTKIPPCGGRREYGIICAVFRSGVAQW